MTIARALLYGRWLHAHEEDSEEEMVFRPADSGLPPSRGRRGLELNPDGSGADIRPGADDRPETATARWRVEDDDWLVVEGGQGDGARRAMRIVAADGGSIVVRKPGRE